MNDDELFNNNFGEWLSEHGAEINVLDDGTITAKLDLNKLKLAIIIREEKVRREGRINGMIAIYEYSMSKAEAELKTLYAAQKAREQS